MNFITDNLVFIGLISAGIIWGVTNPFIGKNSR